jgi:xanthine/uracil permease
VASPKPLTYNLDDLPPWSSMTLYGLQWALIFLPSLMILAVIASEYAGLAPAEKVLFFQRVLITCGGVMILQTLWGHRYPLLDGPSSALLLAFIIFAPQGIPVIQGGMILGGIYLVLLSASGLMRFWKPLFTDPVIGVILILVAITLLPYLVPMIIGVGPRHPHGEPLVFAVSLATVILIALLSHWLSGFPKTIALFLGIILGTLGLAAMGRLKPGPLEEALWFSVPQPLFPSFPQFSWNAALAFLLAYLAVVMNAVGSIYSVGEVVGKEGIEKRVSRGIGLTGVGGIAGGALGVIGTVSFALSPGIVLVTRVGSRFPLTLCGAIILSLAFFQKLTALMTAIPSSVVGAAMMIGLAAQIGAGISIFARKAEPLSGRDYLVIGLPILMGGLVSILPEGFFQDLPGAIRGLLKNGLVVGIVLVLLLEHVLLPDRGKGAA